MDKPKRYRKRPIVIEAIQWTGANLAAVQTFVGANNEPGGVPGPAFDVFPERGAMLYVHANRSWLPIDDGEWIATDSEGFYPIKEGVFATTYEEVEPAGELSN
jgi:hypothetical protein